IKKLEDEKNKIENCEYDSKSKKEEINSLEKENDKIKTEVKIYEEIKKIKEEEKIEEEKIKIKNGIKSDCENKINKLNNEIKNKKEINNKEIKNNKNILNIILMGILIILNILINIIKSPKIVDCIVVVTTVAYLIINLIIFILNKNKLNKKEKINNLEKIKIEKEIEILEENIKNTEKEINEIKNNIEEKNKIKIKEIKNKFNNEIEIDNLFNDNLKEINYNIDYLEKQLNLNLIRINTINIEEKNINEKLDNKIACEEKLEYLYEQKKELEELNKIINLAKETLEESYDEIKKNITPKFTKELSNNIEMISDGKYKKANFNSDKGLTIEAENGEYIECNKLSIGTIDQLYLSLRLSATKEITEETIPIILDESFAYFDNQRLENVIKYLDSNYNNQIIIFTCTNREKEILDKLNIEYNLVNL
ncbi:MAG: ATP-binding protein, partial [Clostridia bacterium]